MTVKERERDNEKAEREMEGNERKSETDYM